MTITPRTRASTLNGSNTTACVLEASNTVRVASSSSGFVLTSSTINNSRGFANVRQFNWSPGVWENVRIRIQPSSDSSGLKKDDLRKIAEGHVWTGAQAKERKLVDHIGGLSDALADAKKRAGLSESEDVSLDVITGHEDDLLKMTGLASVLAHSGDADAVKLAAKLLLGDPDALAFALQSEGKPLAMSPVSIRVR